MTVSPEPVFVGSLTLTPISDIATALTLNTNGTSVAAQNYNITNLTIAAGLQRLSERHRTRRRRQSGYFANDKFTITVPWH